MRRLIAGIVIGIGLAVPAVALSTATTAAVVEQETAPLVQQQIISDWRTSDGAQVVTALCKPSNAFSVSHQEIFSDRWNCMETDVNSRVFWISAHVADTAAGGVEKVTATGCNAKFSHRRCPSGLPNPDA
jgi:hypothetical protein